MEKGGATRDETAQRGDDRKGQGRQVDFYATVFEVIDMRSFSNLWYWIGLAVAWSTASHWILGVPFDMLQRARRRGGRAADDFEQMVRINVNRLLYIDGTAGLWILGFSFFVLSTLAITGFYYGVEFSQAVFLLGAPFMVVGYLSIRTARRLRREAPTGEALYKRMLRHRMAVQGVGVLGILCAATWGMYQNMVVGALGG